MEALVSPCEVTPDEAAERRWAQDFSAAFVMCVRRSTGMERTSSRQGAVVVFVAGHLPAVLSSGTIMLLGRESIPGQAWKGGNTKSGQTRWNGCGNRSR